MTRKPKDRSPSAKKPAHHTQTQAPSPESRERDVTLINDSAVTESFVRASGPGGQNVNKVATAVQLRFDVTRSALDHDVRQRLRALAGAKMTADGVLVIEARRYRTQAQNRQDARERLAQLIRQAVTPPKRRRKTQPSAAAHERRILAKARRGETKQRRGRISFDE